MHMRRQSASPLPHGQSSPQISTTSCFPASIALNLVLISVLTGLLALASPSTILALGPGQPDDSDDLRAQLCEHRQQEAAAKASRLAALQKAEAEKTANQGMYDVHHYDLDLDLNPSTHILTGTVAVTAEVTGSSISTLDLDLDLGMTVSAATAAGLPTTFSRLGHLVTVDLDRAYLTGESVVVSVSYSGNPGGGSFGWDSFDGQHMIWTLSEPYGAREWWPCKDLNSDKADSVDIQVTVPDNLYVASNGLLISDVDNGTTRTFHWQSRYPIATYLVSLAIHPYTFYNDWYTPLDGGDPMEVQFYVFPSHFDAVQANYALTVPMLEVFSQGFGEYPFVDEKYGHAEFTWGGGMEHQTLTSMGGWSEDLISHELAHQWFGDLITCDDFGHIWLNEGFATWCEAYWKEQTAGFSVYQQYMEAAAYFGEGTIFVENPSDFYAIFNTSLSYNKASWVVHMVRGVVGDEAFFAGLADYRATYGYGSATTEQFRDILEAAAGVDLDAFFDQWIYGEYFPVYEYSWNDDSAGTLDLTINQVQTNTGLFTMPIMIRVETTTGTTDFTVQNSQVSENYQLAVSGEVLSVTLDPEDWILCQIRTSVTNPTFDQGILVVNGVDWSTYGSEILAAYENSIFWGTHPFSFWDTFAEPGGGYPSPLPEPVGHGSVPGDILGQYSAVVWVGNHYNGDLADWQESPILSYLETGGNVLLMTRRSQSFLGGALGSYLGVSWAESGVTLYNCIATYAGLGDIGYTGDQSWNDVYWTTVGPESTLLFKTTTGFSGERGLGVWAHPAAGGSHRPDGGQFVHIAGRPYRMNHDAVRSNVEHILSTFFGEPYTPITDVPDGAIAAGLSLLPNYPNPFNPQTVLPFVLPAAGPAELTIYDAAGRRVRTLVTETLPAGRQSVSWDGTDHAGRAVASGTYYARLNAGGQTAVRPLVLVR